MTQTKDKVIGFILKGYPRLSETFIVNEILLLEALGYKLHIFALRNPDETKIHEKVRHVRAPVTYIPDSFWRFFFAFLIANMRAWWRRPDLYWQAFRFAVLRSLSQRSSSTIKRFVQAAYLAERGLPGTAVAHVHAHFSHDPATVAYFAGWLTGISYSFSAHAKDIYLEEHDFLRRKIWWAKFAVTCTECNRDYLLRLAGAEAAVFRSYHGVDLNAFKPAPSKPLNDSCPVIISIGRLVPKKGFPVLLHALHQLKQQQVGFHCFIIGGGPMQSELEKLVADLGLRHCVEILPPMSQAGLLLYYRQADIFALACKVQNDGDRDGIPNVLVEAMAMGIPVVSTSVSGIPELIENGISGLLVQESDPSALAEAILTLLRDPEMAQRFAMAGRAKVERDFDATRNVKKIGKLLRAALAGTAPASTTVSRVWEMLDQDGRFKGAHPVKGGIAAARKAAARRGPSVAGNELTKIDKFLEPRIGDIMASASLKSLVADKLYTLNIALDNRQMRDVFASLARLHLGEDIEMRHLGIEVMRRRNQRCVIRYRVEAFDTRKQRAIEWRVIGKIYKANRGERVFRSMLQLWEDGFSRHAPDGISIPEPLDFSSFLCMLFQEEVPGLPVKTLLKQSPDAFFVRRLARTLAKLHQSPITPDNMMTVTDHLQRCHPTHQFLSLALPELSGKIDYIVDNALKIEAALGKINFTPIHGDFHLGQVHLERGRTWLIDFDAMGYGDPAADLGNVLVFLKGKAGEIPNLSELVQAFLDEYFSIMKSDIAERIPLYEALTHLRRACKSLRLQEHGWERRATRMIELGVACIDRFAANGGVNFDHELKFQEALDEAEAFY
jgi:glycosyltransferase involved in cell wall biosynthesis